MYICVQHIKLTATIGIDEPPLYTHMAKNSNTHEKNVEFLQQHSGIGTREEIYVAIIA
jgi:hypothetical protein